MGDAIARFRELAERMRRHSDAAFMQAPQVVFYGMSPTEGHSIESSLRNGDIQPREFARLLRSAVRDGRTWRDKDAAALHGKDPRDWTGTLGGKREAILARAPTKAMLDKQHAAALSEATAWGDRMFASIERRLAALSESTLVTRATAADAWECRHSRGKLEYAKQLVRWQKAFDALAPYLGEPPTTATSTKQKKTRSDTKTRRGNPGGRPDEWSKVLKRQILADHAMYLKDCTKKKKKPLKQSTWVVTAWATEDGRQMSRKDALALWQAAKREKYRHRR